jgi:hypothetical protein
MRGGVIANDIWVPAGRICAPKFAKVFCFFFSKKKFFLPGVPRPPAAA